MDTKQKRKLLREAMAAVGMVREVVAKAELLKNRIVEASADGEPSDELLKEARRAVRQMQADLAKYSLRIQEIHEELRNHGLYPETQ